MGPPPRKLAVDAHGCIMVRSPTDPRIQIPGPPATPSRRISPRPKRWAAAVAAPVNLQEEYRAWLDNLPPNLESSPLAHKLRAIAELDLEELQAIEPPRGYGRD